MRFSFKQWKVSVITVYSLGKGRLAQLARAFGLHPKGHRFEPCIAHMKIDEIQSLEIEGGTPLSGEITTNTSKNGGVALICAALLNDNATTIHGIPRISEVERLLEFLTSINISCTWSGSTVVIQPPKGGVNFDNVDREAAKAMRAVLMIIGPLVSRKEKFNLPHSGGCDMGERIISAHKFGLEALGVTISTGEEEYKISGEKIHTGDVVLYETSDTATNNLLMAASRVPGKTIIRFASSNYQVQELCTMLQVFGVKIDGVGTSTLIVHGVEKIDKPIEYNNSEDPIEAMMFLTAAIITKSTMKITRAPIDFLLLEITKLKLMGADIVCTPRYKAKNGHTDLVDITVAPAKLIALEDKIHALPYPGINIDNLPFFVPICVQAQGESLIHDWMWENRVQYFLALKEMGADVQLLDPHRMKIKGARDFKPAELLAPRALRPAIVIFLSMLAAEGKSILRDVYPISRGCEDVVERFCSIGAKVKKIDDSV